MTSKRGVLGAIFAGGGARRFGGGKGAALVGGQALIDRVADALRGQCDALVIVGRDWPGLSRIEDAPAAGLGPLGALAGAMLYADHAGFAAVLTSGCDLPDVPEDLRRRLEPANAVIAGQPLLGLWDSALGPTLALRLAEGGGRSMRGWIAESGAREIVLPAPLANINTREDLARYLRSSS